MMKPLEPTLAEQGVLAVLVLYRCDPDEAASWPLLCSWLDTKGDRNLRHCLVYDNSPSPTHKEDWPEGISFISDPNNGGTAGAYAAASDRAAQLGCKWLLLLDQDTMLPAAYLERAQEAIARAPDAAALVPLVLHGDQPISPAIIDASGSVKPCERPNQKDGIVTAISSGVLIRREIMAAIDFPKQIWLDYVDHWLFLNLNRKGAVFAYIDAKLVHDLSVRTPRSLSSFRLRSILAAEERFYREIGGKALTMMPLRRLLRAFRYLLVGRLGLATIVLKAFVSPGSAAKP